MSYKFILSDLPFFCKMETKLQNINRAGNKPSGQLHSTRMDFFESRRDEFCADGNRGSVLPAMLVNAHETIVYFGIDSKVVNSSQKRECSVRCSGTNSKRTTTAFQ